MDLTARNRLASILLALLLVSPAAGQPGEEIPNAPYYVAVRAIYSGEYRDAERALRRETQRGVRAGQARWIDSICYHAMLGEALYHQGRNAESLAEFDQACQLLLAYPNWLLQVKFQSDIGGPRTDPNRARRVPPWGRSGRQFALAQFPASEQVLIGDPNAERTLREGGVFRQLQYWRVNVVEVLRTSALAIRRRNELLGPLAAYDQIAKELSDVLARGNLAPPNHWSAAWIDLLRGIARAGAGKPDEADMLLGRSLVLDGQFDHPLTCVGLLEQGRLAMARGDNRRAASLFAEAGFSAYYYENWDVLTESVRDGWINHLAGSSPGVYPPLEPVAAWAQVNRLQHVAVKLRIAQAESLLWLGQLDAAAAVLDDATRRLGEMRSGLPAIHQLYVQAAVHMMRGQIEPGAETLVQALSAQAGASLRNFQIIRTNEMYDARAVSPRVAVDLYASLLADPGPADWVLQPGDAMAVLGTPHDAAFDRWFLAALERKDLPLALEISERAKRRRFLVTRPLGGRLLALRAILESPEAELSREAVLLRQQILASFPAYRVLANAGEKLYEQLQAGPVLAVDSADTKPLATLYDKWAKNADQRQILLAQLAVRRLPSTIEFPPLRTAAELQQALGEGEALIVFHSAAGNLYGFLITTTGTHAWQLPDARRLRAGLGEFLKALGNYGANRQLSVAELRKDAWRDAAAAAYTILFADARLDLAKTTSLVIVPDDLLWYMPFEALLPPSEKAATVLADRVPIRYGPTAALAIRNPRPLRRPKHTGIVATLPAASDDEALSEKMLQELEKVVTGPVRLPTPLPEPSRLISPLLDDLLVFDDAAMNDKDPVSWSPLPRSRKTADEALQSWFALPYGGPQRIVLTGVSTQAETGLKSSRRGVSTGTNPGSELFQSLCGLMSNGARTILVTRWRTGGRTNFELVREFMRELPRVPATDAWQRSCVLARESPLEASGEPRLKRSDETGELPTAEHPFFWSGYMLIDTGPRPERDKDVVAPGADAGGTGENKTLPSPAKPDPQPSIQPAPAPANDVRPADTSFTSDKEDAEVSDKVDSASENK